MNTDMVESVEEDKSVEIATTGASQYAGKRQRTRRRLLAAATSVVADNGVDGATIGAIANEAGMVPGTIYHHFGGRDALIADVVDEMVRAVGDGMRQARQAVDDPAVRIALAGVGLFDRAMADRDFARAFARLLDPASGLRQLLHDQVAEVVTAGAETGRFTIPAGVDAVAVDALLAVASAAALRVAGGELNIDARQSVAEVMLTVVGVDPTEAAQAAKEACAMMDAVSIGTNSQS